MTYKIQARNCSVAKTARFGAKLLSTVSTTEVAIESSMIGRRPRVSANQPHMCDVRIMAAEISGFSVLKCCRKM